MNKEMIEKAYAILKDPIYCFDNGQGDVLDCERFETEDEIPYECGAQKIALILDDCVLKKPYTGFCEWTDDNDNPIAISEAPENQGSCETEALIYKLAEEKGLEKFFAKSEYLGDEIFMQERAEELVYQRKGTIESCKIEKKAKELGLNELYDRCSSPVLNTLIEEYPIEELLKLQDFIVEYDIDDLHGHNVGWCNGKLKFIDYSGTNETTADFVRADFRKKNEAKD